MDSNPDNLDRITASPGSPEYAKQFERQSNAAMAHFWRQPIVRFVCVLMAILWVYLGALRIASLF